MRVRCSAVAFLLLTGLAASCGGDSDPPASGSGSERTETGAPAAAPTPEEADETVSSTGYRFSPTELSLPAGKPSTMLFINNDPSPHNVAIYTSKGGKKLFIGDLVDPESKTTYNIPPLEKGKFYFQCDLKGHEQAMFGDVVVR